jgi:hypothetical protein
MVSSAMSAEVVECNGSNGTLGEPYVTLVMDENFILQKETAIALQDILKSSGKASEIVSVDQVQAMEDLEARHCILLVDLDDTHLLDTDPAALRFYQTSLTRSKYVLWAHVKESQEAPEPYWAMAHGLCRVCRSENPLASIISVTLEPSTSQSAAGSANKIAKVFHKTYHNASGQVLGSPPE